MKKLNSNGSSLESFSVLATAFVLSFLFLLSGCNTVEGFGKDVEEAGETIEDSAN